jgi:hypothetical protein
MTLCITDPGFEVDLFVTTDSWTMTRIWYGELPLKRALAEEAMVLDGPRRLCETFPAWLMLSVLAVTEGRLPLRAVSSGGVARAAATGVERARSP